MEIPPDELHKDVSILYVEDEESIREGYGRALHRISNNIYTAQNGQEGLEIFKKHRPDIVISDIKMPIMNGIDMLKFIRKIDPHCQVIFTTAHNDSAYLLEALELEVNGYLQKPVSKDLLKSKVQKLSQNIVKEKLALLQQKEIEAQKAILQNVLDHEQNLLLVTDFQNALFANKAFLETFGAKEIREFNQRYSNILDIFLPLPNYLHQGLLKEGENFYDMLLRYEDTKRTITLITVDGEPKAYKINISKIVHEDIASYLISLTDITKMNIQKLGTEKKAFYDNLTGVYNRNKFDELFESELNRVKRYHNDASIMVLDIDHFKKFNDTYGHLIGDEVLVLLAKTIRNNIRNTDIFARWGGEEFVLLLTETPSDIACKIADNLRVKIEDAHHPKAGQITASFGITQLLASDTIQSAFQRCDQALYMAKAAGRNRVECIV